MKRPILIATIGYILGIIWELYFKISIVPFYILSLIIFSIFNKKILKCKQIIILILIFFSISNIQVKQLNKKYDTLYNNLEEIKVIGTIVSEPQKKEYKTVYKIKVETINKDKKYKNTYLFLNIKNSSKQEIKYGDKIIFNGIFSKPQTQRNYKGFDYKEYLKTIKVYGSVTLDSKIQVVKKNNINLIFRTIFKIKQNIQNNVTELLPKETSNIVLGIILGDTEDISKELKEKFKTSSLYHILAVSGTHISYLIIGTTFILEKSKISKRKSRILTIIVLIFFMILTGLSPSVIRAGTMGIILIGARNFS